MTGRRTFLRAAAAAAGAAALAARPETGLALPRTRGARASSLRILFIGGTGFIGPHMVRAALARGHVPTLFNRAGPIRGFFRRSSGSPATVTAAWPCSEAGPGTR
jgi:2'-hydroxyisoflavone reductase